MHLCLLACLLRRAASQPQDGARESAKPACPPACPARLPCPAAVVRERVYDIRRAVQVVEGEPMEMEVS